jgi:hypothetical protein
MTTEVESPVGIIHMRMRSGSAMANLFPAESNTSEEGRPVVLNSNNRSAASSFHTLARSDACTGVSAERPSPLFFSPSTASPSTRVGRYFSLRPYVTPARDQESNILEIPVKLVAVRDRRIVRKSRGKQGSTAVAAPTRLVICGRRTAPRSSHDIHAISRIVEIFRALQFNAAHGPANILLKSRKEFWKFRLTFGKGLLN